MAIKSILKPDGSIALGIATGIFVTVIYDRQLPSGAVMHATDAGDGNIEAARKKAAWTSAAVLSGVTLLTRDVNVFVLGAVVLFALDMHTRHANASNPDTQELVSAAPGYGAAGNGQLRSVS
jgi:hypothetical protein